MRFIDFGDRNINIETVVQFLVYVAWFENDPYSQKIINLFERNMLGLHLVPDGIGGFHTGTHFIVEPHLLQLPVHRHGKMLEQSVTGCFRRFQFQIDKGIFLRMLILEAQVFQLRLDGEKPQTVC